MARLPSVNRNVVDSDRVRRAFSRQAGDYDAYAVVQKRVIRRLLQRLVSAGPVHGPALEVGTGTGELARQLLRSHGGLQLALCDIAHGMTCHAARSVSAALAFDADAQALPLRDGHFALVLSSSVYQWVDDLPGAFSESFRVLSPGGLFAFALFGERTLYELRESHRHAVAEAGGRIASHVQEFHSRETVAGALESVGFNILSLESLDEVERHPDVPVLLQHLKKIGAGNASSGRPRGMASRRVVQRMIAHYRERFGGEDSIPATYEVIYGLARKPLRD